MITRNLDKAREAYLKQDTEASRLAHETAKENIEKHKKGGEFLKSLVYGGLDGIITTFSIIMASLGANLSYKTCLILGISNMLSDGISMGLGDYLSSKAEADFTRGERARETWEVENNPEGEKKEMEELYVKKGME
jgi:VIT1/CCC1 family predicted Fe2+/Mn2+ transporter